jgi:hypothetical protein
MFFRQIMVSLRGILEGLTGAAEGFEGDGLSA